MIKYWLICNRDNVAATFEVVAGSQSEALAKAATLYPNAINAADQVIFSQKVVQSSD